MKHVKVANTSVMVNPSRRLPPFVCVFLCFLLMIVGQFAHANSIQTHPGQSIEQIARKAIPDAAELQHKVVNVDLDSAGKVIVAFYLPSKTATNFTGIVLIPESKPNVFRVTQLPPILEGEGLFATEVTSVFSVRNGANNKLLVVLYRYFRFGTGDDYDYSGYVYSFNGKEWEMDTKCSQLLNGISKASSAKKKLLECSDKGQ